MDRYYSFTRFWGSAVSRNTRYTRMLPSLLMTALLPRRFRMTPQLSRLFYPFFCWSSFSLLLSLFSSPLLFPSPLLKLTMAALLFLFAIIILFTCGLIKYSYFFLHPPKLLAWLASFLCKASSPKSIEKTPKKKDGEEVVVNNVVADKAGIETIFSTFDRDGDGFITAEELEESFKRLGLTSTRNEIASMMERVDANGDGLIDLEEFGELYGSLGRRGRGAGRGGGDGDERVERGKEEEEEGEMELREAFDVFDENGDGLITVEELGLVLASLGLKRGATAEDCRDMIKKVDLDGDGMVNFGEFKRMMVEGGKLF